MSEPSEPSQAEEIDVRLTIDADLGDLYEYMRGKSRKGREALHLMRLGMMFLNGELGVPTGVSLPTAPSGAPAKSRASRSSKSALVSQQPVGRKAEATGLDGLGALQGFSADFFAAPPQPQ